MERLVVRFVMLTSCTATSAGCGPTVLTDEIQPGSRLTCRLPMFPSLCWLSINKHDSEFSRNPVSYMLAA